MGRVVVSVRVVVAVSLAIAVGVVSARASFATEAARAIPTIARLEGSAVVLTPPAPGQVKNLVSMYGKKYASVPAKVGMEVVAGSVIHTSADGKVRLVYPGGDYMSVSPNSMFRVIARAVASQKTQFDLISGSVRSLITKRDDNEEVEVRSRTAVMGVRGTDFHVKAWSESGGSQVSVLRGSVAVSPRVEGANPTVDATPPSAGAPAPEPVVVPAGSTATQVAPTSVSGPVATPQVIATDKDQLTTIQTETTIAKPAIDPATVSPAEAKNLERVAALEQKAADTVMGDIQRHDPELYQQITSGGAAPVDADQIQTAAIDRAIISAPENPKTAKPAPVDVPEEPETSLPPEAGPALTEVTAGMGIGSESFAVKGGLSDFESSAGVLMMSASFLSRMDPSQGDRWALLLNAQGHSFVANVKMDDGATEKETFWRVNADVELAREMLASPVGHPTSLLIAVGAGMSRLPGFAVSDVRRGRGSLESKTWSGPTLRAIWKNQPADALGMGVDAGVIPTTFTEGKGRVYDMAVFARPRFGFVPEGWFVEGRLAWMRESRTIPFHCSGQPECVTDAVSTSSVTSARVSVGSEF